MPDAKRREIEKIIGRSLLTAETFATELRARLTDLSPEGILSVARQILDEFEPILSRAMADAELAAWVSGTDSVVRILPSLAREALEVSAALPPTGRISSLLDFGDDEPIIRFPLIERAAESLLERNIVTRAEFDQLGREARARAFTVARQESEDAIATIRNVLAETIQEGASLGEFRKRLGEDLDGSFIGPAHRENVYRTNIQAAFHQAHDELADNPIVSVVFPYQSYEPITDGRTREDHLALKTLGLNGTNVYRRDDPFWDLFTPPWGYQCRCGVTLLSVEAAARRGVREAQEWDRTGVPPTNPEHRLEFIPFRPEADFSSGRRLSLFVRMAQVHAPKGGVSVGSKKFKGGEFIPGDVIEKATKEEKAKLEGKAETKADPKRKAPASAKKSVRFEAGKRLSKAEKGEVLKKVGDVYRDNGLKKDRLIGFTQNDEPIMGYPIRPDLFVTSDITGSKIRHFITLSDGRKAHPSELFPNLTQSDISRAQFEVEFASKMDERDRETRNSRIVADGNRGQANRLYAQRNRPLQGSFFSQNESGHVVRVDGSDPKDVDHFESEGFFRIDKLSLGDPDIRMSVA